MYNCKFVLQKCNYFNSKCLQNVLYESNTAEHCDENGLTL